ncbi:MAG: AAA family ATPase [Fusobacteriaceae bacterium]
MKLIKLELMSNYKKLKKTIFKFKSKEMLCLVGENGSGKTILFELIIDILSSALSGISKLKDEKIKFKLVVEINSVVYHIEKIKQKEKISIYEENEGIKKEIFEITDLIIVSYSSAKRTILSDTYYKQLLELLEKKQIDGSNITNYFIREKVKKCIMLYLFLFKENYLKDKMKELINISPLKRVKINLEITTEEFENLQELKELWGVKEGGKNLKINLEKKDLKKIVKFYEKNNPQAFYYLLENLELLNLKQAIKEMNCENLTSEKIEDNYLSKKFYIEEIEFENGATYNYLSEGELQLLETLGVVIFFESKHRGEILYIFDEPTTHLNVNWLSEYVSLLKSVLNNEKNSQLLISTHNLDIIGDLQKSNIHLIKNGNFEPITEETFGADEIILNRILFNKIDTISKNVKRELYKFNTQAEEAENNIEKLKTIKEKVAIIFANSPEKYILLKEIKKMIIEAGGE